MGAGFSRAIAEMNLLGTMRNTLSALHSRGVHISMGKFQSGFLKKHIIFPGCILFPESKYVRVEHFDPGK